MFTPQVFNYLNKLGYKLPKVCVEDTFWLNQIVFPGCRLVLFRKDKIDHLFIDEREGFPYAVAIINHYFALDAEERQGLFTPTYKVIILNNIRYTELSPTLFDKLAIHKFAMLERSKVADDYRYWEYSDYSDYGDCGDHNI